MRGAQPGGAGAAAPRRRAPRLARRLVSLRGLRRPRRRSGRRDGARATCQKGRFWNSFAATFTHTSFHNVL